MRSGFSSTAAGLRTNLNLHGFFHRDKSFNPGGRGFPDHSPVASILVDWGLKCIKAFTGESTSCDHLIAMFKAGGGRFFCKDCQIR